MVLFLKDFVGMRSDLIILFFFPFFVVFFFFFCVLFFLLFSAIYFLAKRKEKNEFLSTRTDDGYINPSHDPGSKFGCEGYGRVWEVGPFLGDLAYGWKQADNVSQNRSCHEKLKPSGFLLF